MTTHMRRLAVTLRDEARYRVLSARAQTSGNVFPLDANASFVVSIASYPGRAALLPAVFESLARQTRAPRHAYLVLAEEEFPHRQLPVGIRRLQERGVEILWTFGNPYAVKMLLPVLERHPNLGIVTLADDFLYAPRLLEWTVAGVPAGPRVVAAWLGFRLYREGRRLSMTYRSAPICRRETIHNAFYMMGCGAYYAPQSLDARVSELEAVRRIVPGRGSDIWFWAAAIAAGSKLHVLNSPNTPLGSSIWSGIPAARRIPLKDAPDDREMERRFHDAIDFFGIRQLLLETLPERAMMIEAERMPTAAARRDA